jgi:putative iron-dependent peroxidase
LATPQSGILPPANSHGLFLTLDINGRDQAAKVRHTLAEVPALTQALSQQHPNSQLTSVVAIGAGIWSDLTGRPAPQQLAPFRARVLGHRKAPATPRDVLLQIRSERRDLNFELARQILAVAVGSLRLVEETPGFSYLDSRDLTGFVDGTENPEGNERAKVALIDASDPAGEAGSYVLLQRFVHDLDAWTKLPQSEQEAVIGRTKDTDEELADHIKPHSAHISRVVIEEEGEELEILRQSMPYGDSQQAGLVFIAYSARRDIFDKMLDRMFDTANEGVHDHLMDYTRAETGAFFFAPSLEQLIALN